MMMDKLKRFHAPLYERLNEHADHIPVSFHVPGHRYGRALEYFMHGSGEEGIRTRFGGLLPVDVTELSTTDDLHAPEDVIAESQQLAAALYEADQTMLLVGGSTAGNIAMILAVCEPGDLIIVQRNVHKSVLNGLRLAGAKAVFLQPAQDSIEGTLLIPELEAVEQALQQHPTAKAVLLSTPNYYGLSVPISQYAACVHTYGIPLLVDEAHGAHYGLHSAFPPSALSQGADAVVQSTHKTLPAMTMGAMLHVRGNRIDVSRLRDMLAAIQSSSPSYPIMASLDIARAMIETEGERLFECGLREVERFRQYIHKADGRLVVGGRSKAGRYGSYSTDGRHEELDRGPGEIQAQSKKDNIRMLAEASDGTSCTDHRAEASGRPEVQQDPLRVVLRDKLGLVSGYGLQRMLEQYGCWAEMADEQRVLLIFGPYVGEDETDRLVKACQSIELALVRSSDEDLAAGAANSGESVNRVVTGDFKEDGHLSLPLISEPVNFSMRRLDPNTIVTVLTSESACCISADTIIPYPPGIPLVYAGERINEEMAGTLARLARLGAKCQGAADSSLRTIRIIRA